MVVYNEIANKEYLVANEIVDMIAVEDGSMATVFTVDMVLKQMLRPCSTGVSVAKPTKVKIVRRNNENSHTCMDPGNNPRIYHAPRSFPGVRCRNAACHPRPNNRCGPGMNVKPSP
jgi:hypothetical protein